MNPGDSQVLFRQEVVQAKRGEWLGSIQLATPLSRWSLTLLFFVLATVLTAFLIEGRYTQRQRVDGQLVPSAGVLQVDARVAGTITRLLVHEGQQVTRGQPLAEIDTAQSSVALGDTQLAIRDSLHAQARRLDADLASQRQSSRAKQRALKQQIASLGQQVEQVAQQVSIQQQQVHSSQALLNRIRPLLDKGYVSAVQVQQEQSQLLSQKAQLKALQRQHLALIQQRDDARQQRVQLPLDSAKQANATQRQLDQVRQQLAQNESQRTQMLYAPRNGTVSSVLVTAGQSVTASEPLLNVLPAGSALQAQLLVPSRSIGFIDPGSRVVLRYQAYPYQKFGQHYGRVAAISRSALSPTDVAALTGQRTDQPLYRVLVKLDHQAIRAYGKAQTLKPGMAVNADILMDRRRLIEWVFEPLYGMGRSLFGGGPTHG